MAKLVLRGILALTSFILALRVVLLAWLVISGILSSICLILALYASFLITSFSTTLLSLLKSTGVVFNFQISYLSTLRFNLLKLVDTFYNFPISNLSTSAFKLTKSNLAANLEVLTPIAFFKSVFVAKLINQLIN